MGLARSPGTAVNAGMGYTTMLVIYITQADRLNGLRLHIPQITHHNVGQIYVLVWVLIFCSTVHFSGKRCPALNASSNPSTTWHSDSTRQFLLFSSTWGSTCAAYRDAVQTSVWFRARGRLSMPSLRKDILLQFTQAEWSTQTVQTSSPPRCGPVLKLVWVSLYSNAIHAKLAQ